MEIKRTPIRFIGKETNPDEVEKEFDNTYKQINQVLGDITSTKLIFYVAETSGGAVTKKLTIEINKYGVVKNLSLV